MIRLAGMMFVAVVYKWHMVIDARLVFFLWLILEV